MEKPRRLARTLIWRPNRIRQARVRPQEWPHMSYTADIPVSQDHMGAGNDVQYARPPLKARSAWFDFFRTDYEWTDHLDRHGQPDDDYLRNRIGRVTLDLKTGQAQIEK
jgi:hypothetical protein